MKVLERCSLQTLSVTHTEMPLCKKKVPASPHSETPPQHSPHDHLPQPALLPRNWARAWWGLSACVCCRCWLTRLSQVAPAVEWKS